jgi:hypothetical protein
VQERGHNNEATTLQGRAEPRESAATATLSISRHGGHRFLVSGDDRSSIKVCPRSSLLEQIQAQEQTQVVQTAGAMGTQEGGADIADDDSRRKRATRRA